MGKKAFHANTNSTFSCTGVICYNFQLFVSYFVLILTGHALYKCIIFKIRLINLKSLTVFLTFSFFNINCHLCNKVGIKKKKERGL